MELAKLTIAGFLDMPVIIYTDEDVCTEIEINCDFNEFYEETGGDGTVQDFDRILRAIINMEDEDGCLFDRANIELERIRESNLMV